MSRTSDVIIAGTNGVAAGWYAVNLAYNLANYYSQAEALTQKVYAAAQTINPEVAQRAHELIAQVADKPDYFHGILGAIAGITAIGFAAKAANKKNYE